MTTIPPKKDRLRKDITSCLNIVDALNSFIIPPHENIPGGAVIDEECQTSAEATFIKVCNKLDNLIDALGAPEDSYEKKLIEVADAEIKALKETSKTAKHCRRPSIIHQPVIGKHQDGSWCAFYGDPNDEESCIIGVGKTVEEAMLDFDNEWTGNREKARKVLAEQATQTEKTDTSKGHKKP